MKKIKVLSVAALLARGIRSIHEETSISELFI
jgi:phosphoribosylpyrophosphate synthetase